MVTVGGESSGAVSTCSLMFSPIAQGYFHRVIIESGACTGPWFGPTDWEREASINASIAFRDDVLNQSYINTQYSNTTQMSDLEKLRQVSISKIVNSASFGNLNYAIDDYLLYQRPRDASILFNGSVIIGGNSGDSTCRYDGSVPSPPQNMSALIDILDTYFEDDALKGYQSVQMVISIQMHRHRHNIDIFIYLLKMMCIFIPLNIMRHIPDFLFGMEVSSTQFGNAINQMRTQNCFRSMSVNIGLILYQVKMVIITSKCSNVLCMKLFFLFGNRFQTKTNPSFFPSIQMHQ